MLSAGRGHIQRVLGISLWCALCGCARETEEVPNTRNKISHVMEQVDAQDLIVLSLPAGGNVRDFGMVANGTLVLEDRDG